MNMMTEDARLLIHKSLIYVVI